MKIELFKPDFKRRLVTFVLLCSLIPAVLLAESASFQSPRKSVRNPIFHVPAKLRARVDFWIDIFTRYGEKDSVIHHRNFPQAVFMTLNFEEAAARMNPVQLEKHRNMEIRREIARIREACRHLASGQAAQTALQSQIEQAMRFLGPGTAKYKELVDDDLIRSQKGIKEKFKLAVERSGRYLPVIEHIFVKEFGLPVELTRLPYVESSFDYTAYSSVGAAGIWQFMPATGRAYGMKISSALDERRDVISATRGAAKYLRDAFKTLGNWPLALTSYNHGVAGVNRKVKQYGLRDIADIVEHPRERILGFASSNFYPEFLAALDVHDRYEQFFPGIQRERSIQLAQRELESSLSVDYLTRQLSISAEELKEYNYALSSRTWKGQFPIPRGYVLKVPQKYGAALSSLRMLEPRNIPSAPATSSVYGGVVYKVRQGDTLSSIARKYSTSVSKLRSYNQLSSDALRVGQLIVVRPKQTETVTEPLIVKGQTFYQVQTGDTLSSIASKFGISTSRLRELNHLKSSDIQIGEKLRVTGSVASVGSVYTVQSGDSLWSIGRKFGVSVSALKASNKLKGNAVKIGQKLSIPNPG